MPYLFYQQERDQNFFEQCEQIRDSYNERNEYISVGEIARQAIMTQADSFYISERECAKIIYRAKQGIKSYTKSEAKRALYEEIERRYHIIQEKHPDMLVPSIAKIIIEEPAPRFYITKARAVSLYYSLLNQPEKKRFK